MLTSTKLRELARACRAFAVKREKDAEVQRNTSAYPAAMAEVIYFQELAAECEKLARDVRNAD